MTQIKIYNDSRDLLNTISGVDMMVMIGNEAIVNLQQITVMESRDTAAWHAMRGSPNPAGIARGKRSINGTMTFINENYDVLLDYFERREDYRVRASKYDYNEGEFEDETSAFINSNVQQLFSIANTQRAINSLTDSGDDVWNGRRSRPPRSLTEVIFDAVVLGENDMGLRTKWGVFGIFPMNVGMAASVNDMAMEVNIQYTAAMFIYPKHITEGENSQRGTVTV